jgi:hypothetical protein
MAKGISVLKFVGTVSLGLLTVCFSHAQLDVARIEEEEEEYHEW